LHEAKNFAANSEVAAFTLRNEQDDHIKNQFKNQFNSEGVTMKFTITTTMKTLVSTTLVLGAMLSTASVFAASAEAKASYNAATERAEGDYKAAKAKCDALKDNAKDVCVAEAKLTETRATANAKANYDNTSAARSKAAIKIADAEYSVEKEKCDDLAGNDKDVCIKTAKAKYESVKADSKAGKKIAEARTDAVDTKNDANYKLEMEKCDALAGTPRDTCVARVNTQFKK
jgi:hypothetical protein